MDVFQVVKALRVQKPGAVRTVVRTAWYLLDAYLSRYYQVLISSSFRFNTNSYLRLCLYSWINFLLMITFSYIVIETVLYEGSGAPLHCVTHLK